MRRFLASLLAAALLCTACAVPAAARETSFFKTFPQDVPASALEPKTPEDSDFAAAAGALEAALKAGTASDSEVSALFDTAESAYNRLKTGEVACMLAYYRDPNTYSAQYSAWNSLYTRDDNRFSALYAALLSSKYAGETGGFDADAGTDVDTDAQLALLDRCDALVSEYWSKVKADYTADIDGSAYTYAALEEAENAGKLSYDQYLDGSVQIARKKNAAVAPLLASLVKLHNEYAVSKGYAGYAEYAYKNVFYRDFSTADAARFESFVKKYIVPVDVRFREISYANAELSEDRLASLTNLSQQKIIDLVRPHMDDVSSEYAKLFDYMLRNRLCDLAPDANKLESSFTLDIPQYHAAYIFASPNGSAYDVSTLIHEFGHFAQSCLDERSTACFDVAEINSQGLEALYLKYADALAGADGGDSYRADILCNLLDSVVQGCLYDEFQQRLYESGGMTTAEMNRLFRSLAEEYGLSFETDDDEAYNWVDVSHTFEEPFYYISYATSAAAALELLTLSETDYNAAADRYLRLTADSGDYDYRALMRREGLPDIFGEKAVQTLADDALRYMEKEVADVPDYTDISGHWFESGAKLAAAEGIMTGSGTRFDPDGKMTRAMLVTALYRAFGGEAGADRAFDDVSDPAAWYYDAVNWAAEQGIAEGTDGRFWPDAAVTRQDMAVILARALDSGRTQADGSTLAAYADRASIADYARGAVTFAAQSGLMQGSGGCFDPTGDATRAQAAQVFVRAVEKAA